MVKCIVISPFYNSDGKVMTPKETYFASELDSKRLIQSGCLKLAEEQEEDSELETEVEEDILEEEPKEEKKSFFKSKKRGKERKNASK